MCQPGIVHTRKMLLSGLRGAPLDFSERAVDVYIRRLRVDLKRHLAEDPIRTMRGVGYAFDEYYGSTAE